MCYFLYGAVNEGINFADYDEAVSGFGYHFRCGDAEAVNNCVKNCGEEYRITSRHCDCDTEIGGEQHGGGELRIFKELLLNLKGVRGIKYVLISKNWWKEMNTRRESVHIDDIDILSFLADVEDNCLYKINLYKKYY